MGEHDNEIRRESGREASRETGRRLKYSRIRYRRVFLIITDLMGIGGAPDAAAYGDAAADTMARLAGSPEKPDVRNLRNLGLFNMKRIPGVDPVTYMMGRYMPLCRKSGGTDLAAGIRELIYADDKYANSVSVLASKRMLDMAGVRYYAYHTTGREISMKL